MHRAPSFCSIVESLTITNLSIFFLRLYHNQSPPFNEYPSVVVGVVMIVMEFCDYLWPSFDILFLLNIIVVVENLSL
jgi:hypothetical protein